MRVEREGGRLREIVGEGMRRGGDGVVKREGGREGGCVGVMIQSLWQCMTQCSYAFTLQTVMNE